MKRSFQCAVAILCLLPGTAVAASGELPFLVGGIQVHELDLTRWADALADSGLNTVSVTVYARQAEWDGDGLTFRDEEPSVLAEIRAARARGLHVVLVLRVAVDHGHERNKFIWHGMIMPSSHGAIRSWFDRYTAFAVKWARICEREGVGLLGIGSELNALNATLPITRFGNLKNYFAYYWYQRMLRARTLAFADQIEQRHLWIRGFENAPTLPAYLEDRYRHAVAWARQAYLRDEPDVLHKINARRALIRSCWLELIAKVRDVYTGRLTYAANFDSYRSVGFWTQLDVIGINAYFSLLPAIDERLTSDERRVRFERRWEEILRSVTEFKREQGLEPMPLIFTEIGYTFRRHSTVEPWAHGGFSVVGWGGHRPRLVVWGDQPVDYVERRDALAALAAVHRRERSELAGLLYWKLSTDRGHEAIEPFVLHIGPASTDGALDELASFAATRPSLSPTDFGP